MENETRPNESRSLSYVVAGQQFQGDTPVLKVEPKAGVQLTTVQDELRRDLHNVVVLKVDAERNALYVQYDPNPKYGDS